MFAAAHEDGSALDSIQQQQQQQQQQHDEILDSDDLLLLDDMDSCDLPATQVQLGRVLWCVVVVVVWGHTPPTF
jgi:hypothetical protein